MSNIVEAFIIGSGVAAGLPLVYYFNKFALTSLWKINAYIATSAFEMGLRPDKVKNLKSECDDLWHYIESEQKESLDIAKARAAVLKELEEFFEQKNKLKT